VYCFIESKSAQKNKKRREKKKQVETLSADHDDKEKTVKEVAPVEEINPIELVKKKIEEAKLAKVCNRSRWVYQFTELDSRIYFSFMISIISCKNFLRKIVIG